MDFKLVSLVLIVLAASQLAMAMEKEKNDIFKAIREHDVFAVRNFLDSKNINSVDANGDTPLMVACVRYIWAAESIDPYHPDSGYARKNDSWSIIEELLKKGANVNAGDKKGNTPLAYACSVDQIRLVRELLKYKANVHKGNLCPAAPAN
jgi:ankyrin repeat protein